MTVTIYHNPRCSKSRATLALLEARGIDPTVVEYLQNPPSAETLHDILGGLGMSAADLMRKGEDEYKSARDKLDAMDEAARIEWLAANPRVIERPIVVSGSRARIGRPPEAVLEIL